MAEPDFPDKRVLLEVNGTERAEPLREVLSKIPELMLPQQERLRTRRSYVADVPVLVYSPAY